MRFIFCLLCFFATLSAKQLNVEVSARSAILMNAETGAILYEKHAHTPNYPASTTKIATALFVLDQGIELDRIATVTSECLKGRPLKDRDHLPPYWLDSDGTKMGLKRGEMIPLESLLHGLMLVSGNDAANVIAESVGGSVPQFMNLLNEYLQSIGCQNTQFRNPHGLHHPDHFTTAFDLALIAKKALSVPKLREIVSTLSYVKPKTNKQPEAEIKMTNPMMRPKSKYYYPKAIGLKTGHTNAAQDTLVAAAEHEGRTLIAVVLGCEKEGARYEEVTKLFETAFHEKKGTRRLMGPENVFAKEVRGSKLPLKAALSKPLIIDFFPSEEPSCKAALHWDIKDLPIRKGQKVGEIHIHDENQRFLEKGDLVALQDVKGTFFFIIKDWVLGFFN